MGLPIRLPPSLSRLQRRQCRRRHHNSTAMRGVSNPLSSLLPETKRAADMGSAEALKGSPAHTADNFGLTAFPPLASGESEVA